MHEPSPGPAPSAKLTLPWGVSMFANPALRRVGLGHLAGGDSPRGSPWNGCGWAAETLNGVVNHARMP